MESTEWIMQLRYKPTGELIANIPRSNCSSLNACFEFLGAKFVEGKVIIHNKEYDPHLFTLKKRTVNQDLVNDAFDDVDFPGNADDFAMAVGLEFGFLPPECTYEDIMFVEQLRILWHVVKDPFDVLLKRMGLTAESCCKKYKYTQEDIQKWINDWRGAPLAVRITLAKAVGLLTILE